MRTARGLLPALVAASLLRCSAAMMFWTALVEISYLDAAANKTVERYCECGIFGRNSPLEKAAGAATLPRGDPRGCGPEPVYARNASSPPWIALVKRGNCTFAEKIGAAKRQGAAGVLVYNVEGSGNGTLSMSHPDAAGIVAVMIGNLQGAEIAALVRNGTEVRLVLEVGNPHGPWMDTYWLYFLSVAFFVVTAASIAYFVFVSASRLYSLRRHKRSERRLKSEAKKAIGRLRVRTLRREDEEVAAAAAGDAQLCAVCIEAYRPGDVVTVLTCDHLFHKTCIEPWLLERRTCPMCKCDILKALGVEAEPDEEDAAAAVSASSSPSSEITVITVAGGDAMYEVPLTEPDRRQHRYDNGAFESDSQAARG